MARIPYRTQEELDPEYRELIVSSLQPGKRINAYSAISNNQEILAGFREFLGALWDHSGLTDRQREIVILTAASEVGSAYEWHQHVNIGTDAGLDPSEIAAIARDDRTSFSPEEQGLIAYTRAVVRGRVEDPVHEALSVHFENETIAGTAATAVGYLALARLIQAFDVEIEDGDTFVGWNPT